MNSGLIEAIVKIIITIIIIASTFYFLYKYLLLISIYLL